jgi:fumarate reductase subunit C
MLDLKLYMAQRISAMIMGPLVLGHLAVMIYAIQGGLSSAEILSRTQGSIFWFVFYGTFVIAVSVHAAIGMRVIMHEWLGLKGVTLPLFIWSLCLILLFMGARAVTAVTLL